MFRQDILYKVSIAIYYYFTKCNSENADQFDKAQLAKQ